VPRRLRFQGAGIRHVTARGNRRQRIFLDEDDRERYLAELSRVCGQFESRVLAWCLMTNHVHLVLRVKANTISRLVQELHGEYAAEFNVRHGYRGHLFQGRFRDEIVQDETYLFEVAPYVDLNPVRAAIVEDPADWAWSSYRALAGLERPRPFHDVGALLDQVASDRAAAHSFYRRHVASRLRHVPFGHDGV
jgi:REP element-mobilizing transposase RayT